MDLVRAVLDKRLLDREPSSAALTASSLKSMANRNRALRSCRSAGPWFFRVSANERLHSRNVSARTGVRSAVCPYAFSGRTSTTSAATRS